MGRILRACLYVSKEYMRQCIEIQPKWLVEIAPHYYQSREIDIDGDAQNKNVRSA